MVDLRPICDIIIRVHVNVQIKTQSVNVTRKGLKGGQV